jgi:hypothetical protein
MLTPFTPADRGTVSLKVSPDYVQCSGWHGHGGSETAATHFTLQEAIPIFIQAMVDRRLRERQRAAWAKHMFCSLIKHNQRHEGILDCPLDRNIPAQMCRLQ